MTKKGIRKGNGITLVFFGNMARIRIPLSSTVSWEPLISYHKSSSTVERTENSAKLLTDI